MARVRVAVSCQKALFAAIAQNFGRQGLHIMTAPSALVHEGCGTRHITVDGADNDLRKALTIARQVGSTGTISRGLFVASRAGVSLKTRDKCGSGQLGLATDGPGPGERQRRRGGELGSHFVGTWTCRDELPKSTFCGCCSKLRETRPTYYDCIDAPGA